MRCGKEDGRCRRSPGTWGGTARRSGRTCRGSGSRGSGSPAGPDRFAPFGSYCRIRFGDDPHLWATTLFDEVADLGYEGAYPSFTRALRRRGLRPRCDDVRGGGGAGGVRGHRSSGGRGDPVGLGRAARTRRRRGGRGRTRTCWSGRCRTRARGAGCSRSRRSSRTWSRRCTAVCARLGGVTRRWRFDRMSTVCHPESGDVTASFAEVAKYYGVIVDVLPVAARLAQGRGGEGQPLGGAAVVADAA